MQPPKNESLIQGLLEVAKLHIGLQNSFQSFNFQMVLYSICLQKRELKGSPNGELANCLVVDVETCVSLKAGPN